MMLSKKKTQSGQRGQGMTEYIVIAALIAVAAIGVFNYFGKTIRSQTGVIATSVGGTRDIDAMRQAKDAGDGAQAISGKPTNMSNFADETEKK